MVKIDQNQFRLDKYISDFEKNFNKFFNKSFFENYFDKQFFLIKNFFTAENQVLPWHKLNLLIEHHRREYPRWSIVKDRKHISPKEFMTHDEHGENNKDYRIDFSKVQTFIREGCTLLFNNIEVSSESIRDLSFVFSKIFQEDIFVNAYASFGENTGFGDHYDDMDTVIFQLEGKKNWKLYGRNRQFVPPKNEKHHYLFPPKEILWEGLLEKGDLIYIPAGFWHEVTSVNIPSLHLTFSIYNRTAFDYISWLFKKIKQDKDIHFCLPKWEKKEKRQGYEKKIHQEILKIVNTSSLDEFLKEFQQRPPLLTKLSLPHSAMTFEQLKSVHISSNKIVYDTGQNFDVVDFYTKFLKMNILTQKWNCDSYCKEMLNLIKRNVSQTIKEFYLPIQHEVSKEDFDLFIKVMIFEGIIGVY